MCFCVFEKRLIVKKKQINKRTNKNILKQTVNDRWLRSDLTIKPRVIDHDDKKPYESKINQKFEKFTRKKFRLTNQQDEGCTLTFYLLHKMLKINVELVSWRQNWTKNTIIIWRRCIATDYQLSKLICFSGLHMFTYVNPICASS